MTKKELIRRFADIPEDREILFFYKISQDEHCFVSDFSLKEEQVFHDPRKFFEGSYYPLSEAEFYGKTQENALTVILASCIYY